MAARLTTPLLDDSRSKPIRGRVDYDLFNYCANCSIKYPKAIQRCLDCKQKIRTKPWHRSKIIRWKRI